MSEICNVCDAAFDDRTALEEHVGVGYEPCIKALKEERDAIFAKYERVYQDRYDLLSAKTTEGMGAAEWQMRTATAERKAREAEAQRDELASVLTDMVERAKSGGYLCTMTDGDRVLAALKNAGRNV